LLFNNIFFRPFSENLYVRIDKNLFRITFDNFIINALEEITENQMIQIYCERIGKEMKFVISNPFNKQDNDITKFGDIGYSTKTEGSGIGIPLAKVIIEKLLGKLEYKLQNQIFSIIVTLPLE